MYDYIIVGFGLFGVVCVNELKKLNKKVLVIEKRNYIGGNVYIEDCEGIQIYKYGVYIFYINDKYIWDYVNDLVEFNCFINFLLVIYKDKLFNFFFNMNIFY